MGPTRTILWALAPAALLFIALAGCSQSDYVALEVGQCLPEGAGVEGRRAPRPDVVPCRDEHRYEVFAVERLSPPNSEWPGEDLVDVNAQSLCARAIAEATGVEPQDIPHDVRLLHIDPTEDSWEHGDRDVECLFRWRSVTTDTLVRGDG